MRKLYFRLYCLFLVFCLHGLTHAGFSANRTFTGPGNFSDATKWDGGTLPAAGDNIEIDGNCVFDDTRGIEYGRLNIGNPNPSGRITWPVGGNNFPLIISRINQNNATSLIDMTNGGVLQLTSSWNMTAGSFIAGSGTVNWYANGSFVIPALITTFNNLTINTGGGFTTTLGRNLTINGNLTLITGTLDVSVSNFSITLRGNFSNSATFTQRTSTVTLSGTTAQTISGTTTTVFNNLVLNNSLGLILNNSFQVNAILTLTAGKITTNAFNITISTAGSVSGGNTTRYIVGNLRKYYNTGSNVSKTFEIGTATSYTPITLLFPTITTAGFVGSGIIAGDHPQLGSSCVDPALSVNHYWNLTNTTVAPTVYNATLFFNSGDYDALASPTRFGVVLNNGAWANQVVTSRLTNRILISGATSFGALAVGESNSPASVTVSANPGTNVCPGTAVTFTAAGVNPGATPIYQWKKNGVNVGTNSPTYIDNSLFANDSIRVVMTSNHACVFIPTVSAINSTITPIIGVWMGTTSSNWSTTTNWCGSSLPLSTSNIVVNSGVPFMPVLSGNTTINNLTLTGASTLTLNGFTLTMNGSLNGAGTLTGGGTSSFIMYGSGVTGNLSLTQTSRTTRTLQNLTLNRTSSTLTLADSVLITGTVTLSNGTLNTAGVLRLLSTSSGTARIGQITSGDITGNITMERHLPSGSGWRLIGSPVGGANLNAWSDDFVIGGFPGSPYPTVTNPSILLYNEPYPGIYDSGYVAPSGMGQALTPGVGFWAYIINTPLTIDVTGSVVKGSQSISLSYTANDLPTEIGWNLISNPFPSTIDWDGAGWTKTNVDGAIYMFDPSSEQYSAYVGGIGVNGGTQYIPSSHAFLVQALSSGASIGFNENVKSAVDETFMKLANSAQSSNPEERVKLQIISSTGKTDEVAIRFKNTGTTAFDNGLDAYKIINWDTWNPAISAVTAGNDYSINTLPELTQGVSIPLRVVAMYSGMYTIKRGSFTNLPPSSCFILEDKLTGVKKDFSVDSVYSCYISDTTWSTRFVLHLSAPVSFSTKSEVCVNGNAIIHLPASNSYDLTWKNSQGNVIRTKTNAAVADTASNLAQGLYTVTISSSSFYCSSVYDTVRVQKDSSYFDVYSSEPTCSNSSDGELLLSCPENGNFTVTVSDSAAVIFTAVLDSTTSLQGMDPGVYSVAYSNGCTSGNLNMTLTPAYAVTALFQASNDTISIGSGGTIQFANYSSGATSYSWDFGDGSFESSYSPSHTYQLPGVYQVILIASNSNCQDSYSQTVMVIPNSIRGYTGEAMTRIILQDNNTLLLISTTELSTGVITILDVSGKEIVRMNTLSGTRTQSINLPELSSGIYSVILSSEQSAVSSRFVISR